MGAKGVQLPLDALGQSLGLSNEGAVRPEPPLSQPKEAGEVCTRERDLPSLRLN